MGGINVVVTWILCGHSFCGIWAPDAGTSLSISEALNASPQLCHLPCCVILPSSNDQVRSTVVSVSACCHGFVNWARLELRFLGLPSLSWVKVGRKKSWGKIWQVGVKPRPLCSEVGCKSRCDCRLYALALTPWHPCCRGPAGGPQQLQPTGWSPTTAPDPGRVHVQLGVRGCRLLL